jgi:uridine phosphorylase
MKVPLFNFIDMQYPPSELVLNAQNKVYHLGLSPENISDTIILVGDQDRVKQISSFFESIEHSSQHREFVCHTGLYKGKRITALSTGIGTDNIDIVVNELDALVNIDLKKRCDKPTHTSLNLIRIGTTGILQKNIPVHSYIVSKFAVGLDNIAHFYVNSFSSIETELNKSFMAEMQLPTSIQTYCSQSNEHLFDLLSSSKSFAGITVTSSGFYGPQGRNLRLNISTQELNEKLEQFVFNSTKVTNFEMESSALFFLSNELGHKAATICLGIANRPNNEFSKGYAAEMNELIEFVLDRVVEKL